MKRKLRMHAVALSSLIALNNTLPTLQVMAENLTDSNIGVNDFSVEDELSFTQEQGFNIYSIKENAIEPVVPEFKTNQENNPTKWEKNGVQVNLSSEIERLIKLSLEETLKGIGENISIPERNLEDIIFKKSIKRIEENYEKAEFTDQNIEEGEGEEDLEEKDYVLIEDEQLANKISESLEELGYKVENKKEIPLEYMSLLTTLDISNFEITSLSGLETAENLEELKASNNEIQDISPLRGLKKLKVVDLSRNKINYFRDFNEESNPSLETLDLSFNNSINEIKNINLPSLKEFNIQFCENISEIENVRLDNIYSFNLEKSTNLTKFKKVSLEKVGFIEINSSNFRDFSYVNLKNATSIKFNNTSGLNSFSYVSAPELTEFNSDLNTSRQGLSSDEKIKFNYIDFSKYSKPIKLVLDNHVNLHNIYDIGSLNIPKVTSFTVPKSSNFNVAYVYHVSNVNADSLKTLNLGYRFNYSENKEFKFKNMSLNSLETYGESERVETRAFCNLENVSMRNFKGKIEFLSYDDPATTFKNVYAPNSIGVVNSGLSTQAQEANMVNCNFDNADIIESSSLINVSNMYGSDSITSNRSNNTQKVQFENVISPNIKVIDISGKRSLGDISSIVNFSSLETISIPNVPIEDSNLFGNLQTKNLKSLTLTENKIGEFSPFKKLIDNNKNLTNISVTNQTVDMVVKKNIEDNKIKIVLDNPLLDSYGLFLDDFGRSRLTYSNAASGVTINKEKILVELEPNVENLNNAFRFNSSFELSNGNRNVNISYNGTVNLIFEDVSSGDGNIENNSLDLDVNYKNGNKVENIKIKNSKVKETINYISKPNNFKVIVRENDRWNESKNYVIKNITINGESLEEVNGNVETALNKFVGGYSTNTIRFEVSELGKEEIVFRKEIKLDVTNYVPVINSKVDFIEYKYGDYYPNFNEIVSAFDEEDGDISNKISMYFLDESGNKITKKDGSLISKEELFGNITIDTKREYIAVFSVEDSDGNITDYKLKIKVNADYIKDLSDLVKAVVNKKLQRKNLSGDLTIEDIKSVEELDFNDISAIERETNKTYNKKDASTLKGLDKFENLKTLNVTGYNISSLKNSFLPKLTRLTATSAKGLDSGFKFNKDNLPSLEYLNLSSSDINGDVAASIFALKNIKEVNLENCSGIKALKGLNSNTLTSLTVSGNIQYFENNTLNSLNTLSINSRNLISFSNNEIVTPNLSLTLPEQNNIVNFSGNTLGVNNFDLSRYSNIVNFNNNKFENIENFSVENLSKLVKFSGNQFPNLVNLEVSNNTQLREFDNNDFPKLVSFVSDGNSNLQEFDIRKFLSLKNFKIANSEKIKEFKNMNSGTLETLEFDNVKSLEKVNNNSLPKLKSIVFSGIDSLREFKENNMSSLNELDLSLGELEFINNNSLESLNKFVLNDNSTLKEFKNNLIGQNGVVIKLHNYSSALPIDSKFISQFKKVKGISLVNVNSSKINLNNLDISEFEVLGLPEGIKTLEDIEKLKPVIKIKGNIDLNKIKELYFSNGFESFDNKNLPNLEILEVPNTTKSVNNNSIPKLKEFNVSNSKLEQENFNNVKMNITNNNLGEINSLEGFNIDNFENNLLSSKVNSFNFADTIINAILDLTWNNLTNINFVNSSINEMNNVNFNNSNVTFEDTKIERLISVTLGNQDIIELSNKGINQFENIKAPNARLLNLEGNNLSTLSGYMPSVEEVNLVNNKITNFYKLNESLTEMIKRNFDLKIYNQNVEVEVPVDKNGKATLENLIISDVFNSQTIRVEAVDSEDELEHEDNKLTIFTDGGVLENRDYYYDNSSIGKFNRAIIWDNVKAGETKEIKLSGYIGGLGNNKNSISNISNEEGQTNIRVKFVNSEDYTSNNLPTIDIKSNIIIKKKEYENILNNNNRNKITKKEFLEKIKDKIEQDVTVIQNQDSNVIMKAEFVLDELPENLEKDKVYVNMSDFIPVNDNGEIDKIGTFSINLTYTVVSTNGDYINKVRKIVVTNYAPTIEVPEESIVISEQDLKDGIIKDKDSAYEFVDKNINISDYEDAELDLHKIELKNIRILDGKEVEEISTIVKKDLLEEHEEDANSETIENMNQLIDKIKNSVSSEIIYTVRDSDNNEAYATRKISLNSEQLKIINIPSSFLKNTYENEYYLSKPILKRQISEYVDLNNLNGVTSINSNYVISKELEIVYNGQQGTPENTNTQTPEEYLRATPIDSKRTVRITYYAKRNEIELEKISLILEVSNFRPKIMFEGDWNEIQPLKVRNGDKIDFLSGLKVQDDDEDLINNVVYTRVNTNNLKEGDTLKIFYNVVDSDGNVAETKYRTIECLGEQKVYSIEDSGKTIFFERKGSLDTLLDEIKVKESNYSNGILQENYIEQTKLIDYLDLFLVDTSNSNSKEIKVTQEVLDNLKDGAYEVIYRLKTEFYGNVNNSILQEVKEVRRNLILNELYIADENLEKAIKKELGLFENHKLTNSDLRALTKLDASNMDIKDLRGLEAAINLTSLNLKGNKISRSSNINLENFINLKELNLSNNNITEFDNLKGLDKLTELSILELQNNKITNLDFDFSNLSKLETLNLSFNNLFSIDNLNSSSIVNLDLSRNNLKEIDNTINLTKLEKIDLSYNNIGSLKFDGINANIKEIDLSNNYITELKYENIEALNKLNKLERLNLSSNSLTTISGLKLDNLQELYISNNKLNNILNLSMPKVTVLDISKNNISSIKGLKASHLEQLIANNNKIKDLDNLVIDNIKVINLSNNMISDIQFLINFKNIEEIYLDENLISTISLKNGKSIFNDLSNLKKLSLNSNNLREIISFKNESITDLSVTGNEILILEEIDLPMLKVFSIGNIENVDIQALINVNLPLVEALNGITKVKLLKRVNLPKLSITNSESLEEISESTVKSLTRSSTNINKLEIIKGVYLTGENVSLNISGATNIKVFEDIYAPNLTGSFNISNTNITELKNIHLPKSREVDFQGTQIEKIENLILNSLETISNNNKTSLNHLRKINGLSMDSVTDFNGLTLDNVTSIENLSLKNIENFNISSSQASKIVKFKDIYLDSARTVNLSNRLDKNVDIVNVNINTKESNEEQVRTTTLDISNNEFNDTRLLDLIKINNLTNLNLSNNNLTNISKNDSIFKIIENNLDELELTINLNNNKISNIEELTNETNIDRSKNVKIFVENQEINNINKATDSSGQLIINILDYLKGVSYDNLRIEYEKDNKITQVLNNSKQDEIENENLIKIDDVKDKERIRIIFNSNETLNNVANFSGSINIIARNGKTGWLEFVNLQDENINLPLKSFDNYISNILNKNLENIIRVQPKDLKNSVSTSISSSLEYIDEDGINVTVVENILPRNNLEIIKLKEYNNEEGNKVVEKVTQRFNDINKKLITTIQVTTTINGEDKTTITKKTENFKEMPSMKPNVGESKVYNVTYKLINSTGQLTDEVLNQNLTVTNYVPTINLKDINLRINTFTQSELNEMLKLYDVETKEAIKAIDNEDGIISNIVKTNKEAGIFIEPISITKLNVGNNEVKYYVTDSDGNTTEFVRNIIIKENEAPTINGVNDIILKYSLKDDFDFSLGVTATDDYDEEIELNINEKDIKAIRDYKGLNEEVTFKVRYSAKDSNQSETVVERNVVISNYEPVMNIDESPVIITNINNLTPVRSGISATDVEDKDITKNIEVYISKNDKNFININEIGTNFLTPKQSYTLKYEITDSDGNTISKTGRTLLVRDSNAKPRVSVNNIIKTNRDVKFLALGDSSLHSEGILIDYSEDNKLGVDVETSRGLAISPVNANEIKEAPVDTEVTYSINYNENGLKDANGVTIGEYIVNNKVYSISYKSQNEENYTNEKYGFSRDITISNYRPVISLIRSSIELQEKKSITIQEIINAFGLSINDKEDGNITNKVNISDFGGLDLNNPKAGKYSLEFIVIDNDSNVMKRTVDVLVKPDKTNSESTGSNNSGSSSGSSGSNSSSNSNNSTNSGSLNSSSNNNSSTGSNDNSISNNKPENEEQLEETNKEEQEVSNENKLNLSNLNLPKDPIKEVVDFKDIPEGYWAEGYIKKLAKLGIINGVKNDEFDINSDIKRADLVVMLVKLLGVEPNFKSTFVDVLDNKYYYNYIGTAQQYKIINGYQDNSFYPEKNITRQDAMVIVSNVLNSLGIKKVSNKINIESFQDYSDISLYARDSVQLLVSAGVISGNKGRINPKDTITRSEVSVIVSNIYDIINEQTSK